MRSSVILLFFVQLAVLTSINGQVGWKNWNTAQFQLSLSKKLDIKVSHMRAFDISNGFKTDFNQSAIQAGYELSRKWEVAAGFVKGGSSTLTDGSSRVTARLGYKVRLANVVNWSNSIQGEIHSATETRYRNRIIWTSRLAPRKRLDFLNLLPSVSYALFYNIGGSPIQYYDAKTGLPVVKQTPDGFHRGRLMLNLNSKINSHLTLSMYYMAQREFNLFTAEYRKINIVKPVTGRVTRAFDDYNVAGLTLTYDINLYPSNKK
jgi:Protein of unknown function (DUF2490)